MLGLGTLARVAGELRRDVAAARERDPAARGVGPGEILASWPGVHAVLVHRVANALAGAGVPVVPRSLAYVSRTVTGIEIHPAAKVGDGFFIDHGMGVVIGETAEIGDNVTLYQGVTLGGTGFASGKRHPTVQDNVTIGSGAKLLGPITAPRSARTAWSSTTFRRTRPSSATPAIPFAWRDAARRVRTPTGSTCPTRSPMPSRVWPAASRRWSRRWPPWPASMRAPARTTSPPRCARCAPRRARTPPAAS